MLAIIAQINALIPLKQYYIGDRRYVVLHFQTTLTASDKTVLAKFPFINHLVEGHILYGYLHRVQSWEYPTTKATA